jgi:hypothetical protein
MSDTTSARLGFFPVVAGDHVAMTQAGSSAVISAGDVEMQQAGSNFILAGGSASVREGGAFGMATAGGVEIEQGGAFVVAAGGGVSVTEGFVGVALSPRVDLKDSRVLVGPAEAAAFGAGLGLVLLVVRLLLGRGR